MKKPLFTRSQSRIKDTGSLLILVLGIFLFLGLSESTAQGPSNPLNARANLNIASSECNCLDNASTPVNGISNGQYSEEIIINSSPGIGGSWTLISASGFYSPSSPAPPGIPIPYMTGTIIPETAPGSGVYLLQGIRVSGQPWNVVFTNGVTHYFISNVNSCSYPTLSQIAVNGPRSVCTNSDVTYTINATLSLASNITWTVTGGTIINGQGTPSISVYWGTTPTVGSVSVTGLLRSYPTQVDPCAFTQNINVSVVNTVAEVMACNNLVNISMNPSCEMYITAEMILQDMQYDNNAYDIVLTDLSNGNNIPLGTLGYGYINKIIKVQVLNGCSGNSCWGYAKIEDKSIPELICPEDLTVTCEDDLDPISVGFPFGLSFNPANISNLGGGRYKVLNFDPCSDITVQYVDEVEFNNCSNPFSSVITRTWTAVDNSGNTSECSHQIFVERALLEDVTFPPNFDDAIGPNPSIEACSGYPTFPVGNPYHGHPHPDFTGYPEGVVCLSATVDYTDTKLAKCGDKSFKILRRWRVIDHCTPLPTGLLTYTQTITVHDRTAPSIKVPEEFEVGTSTFVCGGTIDIPPPILTTPECSTWDYTVSYKPADASGNPFEFPTTAGVVRLPNGNYRINNIITNFPRVWIIYTATDACGNKKEALSEVDIIDTEKPVPVCDKNSIVALGLDGMAWAGVQTFNDGSWDNCGIDRMLVARMDVNTCTDNMVFRDSVKFCCSDIGTTVRVVLRIWDKANNQNECMVETEVQDNIPPSWTSFPNDVTIDCAEDISNLNRFGAPTAADNCSVTVTVERDDRLNDCGIGEIRRIWTAKDAYNNQITRTQIITVRDVTPFVRGNITFPSGPVTINACTARPVRPEDLPVGRQRPTWNNDDCAQVAAEYEDIVFQYTTEACVKILRKWTVIDWCQRDQANPLLPRSWSEFQVIMVNNNVGPNITSGHRPQDLLVTPVGTCTANVRVTGTATDDCTGPEDLVWSFTIDLNNDNTNEHSGNGATINRDMPYGTHKITWTVRDECNNTTTRTNVFTLVDTKAPTPYCISDIVTVIMPSTENVTIWASDFDLGSLDNCTSVVASFSPTNRNLISRTITCDDMTEQTTIFDINVYFIDQQGNSDFCSVKLRVQDNNNTCGLSVDDNNNPNGRISVSGNVFQPDMAPFESLTVQLEASLPEFPVTRKTDADGYFAFTQLEKNHDYIVNPVLNDDHDNGVSTLDLVLIQRHILDLQKLESPYKMIASDVNSDNKINTLDLVELRKVILGIHEEFSQNKSWRFVDMSQSINENSPFPFIDKVKLTNLNFNTGGIDFIGVKIGDVNQSATTNARNNNTESRATTELAQNKVTGKAGEIVYINLSADQVSKVVGMQMSLFLPAEYGQITDITSSVLKLQDENVAWNQVSSGIVNLSWNTQSETLLDGDILTIKVKLLKNVQQAMLLSLLEGGLTPEIYTTNGNSVKNHVFSFTSNDLADDTFALFQNIPNPFSGKTTIGFQLPEAGDVKVTIYDVTGKVIHTVSGQFGKGRHNVDIDLESVDTDGLLYYRVDTKNDSAVRRMISIK